MRKVWVRSLSALAVVIAAVALAACGSSSSKSSSSSGGSGSSGSATSGSSGSATSSGSTTSASSGSGSNSSFVPTGSGGLKLLGSGGTQASESNDPLGIKAQTGAEQKQAITAANSEAAKLGSGTIPKGTTIGIEEIINSVPSAQRADGQLIYALRELGFNVIACDAEGDPNKMESCMTSLVSQGVKAIASLGTDPSLIAQGLQAAKAKNIPVISYSGAVANSPLWYRVYYPNETKAGQVLSNYVIAQMKAHNGNSIWISNYPASWAAERTDALTNALKSNPSIKNVGETTVDSTNPIQGTQQQVIAQYTKDPSTRGYWFAYDAPGAAGAQALAAKDGGKPWPSGPLVVTFHDDQQANGLIRKGQISAVADVNYDASSFEAANAIAQYVAKKTVPPSDTGSGLYGHPMYSYQIITKANNPPAGKFVQPKFDVVSFFTQLWHKEFNLQPAG
jgi:ABC-type sugar transport system substrate-binding protein